MNQKLIEEKIQEITSKIAEKFQPEKIILFGSFAWGVPSGESDVDLFIIKKTEEKRIDRARIVRKIIWGAGIPIDILVYTPDEIKHRLEIEDFFIEDIMKKGKILYSASSYDAT